MLYVGLDIHSKHICACALNENGQVTHRTRVRALDELLRFLKGLPGRFEVCYEASCGYGHHHSGRTPGSGMAHCDAAGVNGSSRITSHGAPPWAGDAEWMFGKSRTRLAPALTEASSWMSVLSARLSSA